MAVFPSLEWFEEVRNVYNSDSTLHSGGGGACDTLAGLKIGADTYLIEFEGLQCASIRNCDKDVPAETDFIIDMKPALWIDMVKNVQAHGKADLSHTLNSIDLSQDDGIAYSPQDDQYRQDLFYRYNQNFQDFFDASSRVKTTYK